MGGIIDTTGESSQLGMREMELTEKVNEVFVVNAFDLSDPFKVSVQQIIVPDNERDNSVITEKPAHAIPKDTEPEVIPPFKRMETPEI